MFMKKLCDAIKAYGQSLHSDHNFHVNLSILIKFRASSNPTTSFSNFQMSAPPPPPYDEFTPVKSINNVASKDEQLHELCQRFEIGPYFQQKLRHLDNTEIVVIVDNSGSMNELVDNKGLTRYQELYQTMQPIIDIAVLKDPNGIDVYALNGNHTYKNVTSALQLQKLFQERPAGFTPLVDTLSRIYYDKRDEIKQEKKILILICTDGEPTTDQGVSDIVRFEYILSTGRPPNVYITIMACTDNDQVMEYLNGWDKKIPKLDVVDDYTSERKQIIAAQGPQFHFTKGDYIVKALVGSMDHELDKLDEMPRPVVPQKSPDSCVVV
jgi:hypothetical protein